MSDSPPSLRLTEERKIPRQDILFSLAGLPGPQRVFFGSSDGGVLHADLGADPVVPTVLKGDFRHRPGAYVTGLALAAGASRLVSGAWDRSLIWWDTATMRPVHHVAEAHAKWIRKVVASPDGSLVASVADDMVCRLWDAATGAPRGELKGHAAETPHQYPSMLFTCAFSPDGSRLATADKTGRILVWEVTTRREIASLDASCMYTWDPKQRRHSIGGVRSLAFSPDGRTLVAGGIGQIGNIDHLGAAARLRFFDSEKGGTLGEFESSEFKGLIERLAFHPRGEWLVACGGDNGGFALLIDPASRKSLHESKLPFHVHDFLLDGDGTRLVAAGHNGIVVQRVG